MAETKVKVRIRPLHGIGGVGNAGDEVWMSEADAKQYFDEGYVEYVDDERAPSPQPNLTPDPSHFGKLSATPEGEGSSDHQIMKPEVRRSGRVVRKK